MALSARERAQKIVDKIEERIGKVEERRDKAVEKLEAKYEEELTALRGERDHALNAPALQQQTADTTA